MSSTSYDDMINKEFSYFKLLNTYRLLFKNCSSYFFIDTSSEISYQDLEYLNRQDLYEIEKHKYIVIYKFNSKKSIKKKFIGAFNSYKECEKCIYKTIKNNPEYHYDYLKMLDGFLEN